jgi:hypothetical protein
LGCVIRGISDLLNGKSASDRAGWQVRSADAASAVAFEILATLRPGAPMPARTPARTAPSGTNRIPLTDLRTWAAESGWCSDVQTATVGDNDWWSFTKRLRQAAVDGEIAFWGRRYVYDFGEDLDDQVLVKIPAEHFAEFGFDCVEVAQADNYEIFTTKTGDSPSAWRGSNFRDLHVDATDARKWLSGNGAAPPNADIAVSLDTTTRVPGDYEVLCALVIENVGKGDLADCLVEVTELSGVRPVDMPMPLVLRSDEQIRNNERGRFRLDRGQRRAIPLAYRRPNRRNEWFFIDENGKTYFRSADATKMVLRIYGGPAPGNALVYLNIDAGWNPSPSVKTVASDYTLKEEDEGLLASFTSAAPE